MKLIHKCKSTKDVNMIYNETGNLSRSATGCFNCDEHRHLQIDEYIKSIIVYALCGIAQCNQNIHENVR